MAAIRDLELARGIRLSERQAEVAKGLLTSGRSFELLVGVAGSGKTSTLAAVRSGFEADGYHVMGTATSGQATKALGEGAGIRSRTVASLTWRLEHQREALSSRHVVFLDEMGMTSDADVAKLLGAVAASGAKLIAVGDYRQIGSVGPGGALEALAARHPGQVWALRDNLRQADPAERHALDHLRAGHVPSAVNWYVGNGRVHPAADRGHAMFEMVKSWAFDVSDGRDVLLIAYHRDVVETLNSAARKVWEKQGRLSGPELDAPGGRRYRAGDRVIAVAPGPNGAWVTSQRAVVSSVDPVARSLVAVTPEGKQLRMGPDHIGADKLAYSFAVTAHRAQGATVDASYVLEDGGGRELAYVAMSRARHESHVHVVAPDVNSAADRLAWAWGQDRRQAWALDREPQRTLAELYTERNGLMRTVPPDYSLQLGDLRRQAAYADQDARELHEGRGRWAGTAAGQAARDARQAAVSYDKAQKVLEEPGLGRWAKHKARRQFQEMTGRFDAAMGVWEATGELYARQLEANRQNLATRLGRAEEAQQLRTAFLEQHPDVLQRLAELGRAIERETELERQRSWELLLERERTRGLSRSHDLGRDLGPGLDL